MVHDSQGKCHKSTVYLNVVMGCGDEHVKMSFVLLLYVVHWYCAHDPFCFFCLSSPSSTSLLHTPREENRTREPIDYFSRYFGWDTWIEIASCTNKLSIMPNPVTAREVAQFVGIHIAMGTLKVRALLSPFS